jgi:hypothetical protein
MSSVSQRAISVYLAKPLTPGPSRRSGAVPLPLPLARAERRIFGPGNPYDPRYRNFFAELLDAFGMPFNVDAFSQARSNSFKTMAAELLRVLSPSGSQYDLAVIAHATPDAEPSYPGCYIAETVSGAPLAFAISEQGTVPAFTALRLVADIVQPGAFHRVLLLILDQRTLLYRGESCLHDCGVALVFAETGDLGTMSVQHWANVRVPDVGSRLGEEFGRLRAAGSAVTLFAGAGLDISRDLLGLPADADVVRAPTGFPTTGVWLSLTARLKQWKGTGRQAVLADYDHELRDLCLCTLDVAAAAPRLATR